MLIAPLTRRTRTTNPTSAAAEFRGQRRTPRPARRPRALVRRLESGDRADGADCASNSHSITSSARASKVTGGSRPMALAVFRLMTKRYRVGCSKGMSPGRVALENAIDHGRRARQGFMQVGAIGHEPAVPGEKVELIDRRQPMRRRVIEHALAVEHRQRVRHHQDRVRLVAIHRRKSPIEVVGLAHAERLNDEALLLRRRGGGFVSQGHGAIVRVPKHRHPLHLRRKRLQKFEPFDGQGRRHVRNAGDRRRRDAPSSRRGRSRRDRRRPRR